MAKKTLIYSTLFLILISFTGLKIEAELENNQLQIILEQAVIEPVFIKDSVFLEYHIFCFFHFNNRSSSSKTIRVPWGEFCEPVLAVNDFYGIYQNDTIRFYGGHTDCCTVLPSEQKTAVFEYGGMYPESIYNNRKYKDFISEKEFFKNLLKNSRFEVIIEGVCYKIVSETISISYQN